MSHLSIINIFNVYHFCYSTRTLTLYRFIKVSTKNSIRVLVYSLCSYTKRLQFCFQYSNIYCCVSNLFWWHNTQLSKAVKWRNCCVSLGIIMITVMMRNIFSLAMQQRRINHPNTYIHLHFPLSLPASHALSPIQSISFFCFLTYPLNSYISLPSPSTHTNIKRHMHIHAHTQSQGMVMQG